MILIVVIMAGVVRLSRLNGMGIMVVSIVIGISCTIRTPRLRV